MVVYLDTRRGYEMLPIGPFRAWMDRHVERHHICDHSDNWCEGWSELAGRLGVTNRTIDRWRFRQGYIRLDAVDRAACVLGSPPDEIYPGVNVFAPAHEPELRCPGCDAPVIRAAPLCRLCKAEVV